jgi:hypothetical protein
MKATLNIFMQVMIYDNHQDQIILVKFYKDHYLETFVKL